MTAYYNEIDPYAAQWLRNLIDAGHIAPGIVDERSIEDVFPSDLRGFTQCHFFAGIGVWSYALRLAGWSDDRPVWTGSCPCQPFSQAGQGAGLDDERHLWPHWHHLIKECSPGVIVGGQVASKDAEPWLDLVHDDMEALAYAFGAVAFPSAGVGAPHIRDRTYWVANAAGTRPQGRELGGQRTDPQRPAIERGSAAGRLADYNQHRCVEATGDRGGNSEHHAEPRCELGGLADRPSSRRREECADARRSVIGDCAQGLAAGSEHGGGALRTGPTNSVWRNADWLLCRDGKWRPVEPGTFPLAHGAPARVGRLRAYGNAINAQAARTFIEAVMEASNA